VFLHSATHLHDLVLSWLCTGKNLRFIFASVAWWSEILATDPEVRVRFPATRFSENQCVWNDVHSASWVQLRSYLIEKVAALMQKHEITAVEDSPRWLGETLYLEKLVLTSPTSGGRSIGIVRSQTKATELYNINSYRRFCILNLGIKRRRMIGVTCPPLYTSPKTSVLREVEVGWTPELCWT
jgi:hypothetical protein